MLRLEGATRVREELERYEVNSVPIIHQNQAVVPSFSKRSTSLSFDSSSNLELLEPHLRELLVFFARCMADPSTPVVAQVTFKFIWSMCVLIFVHLWLKLR